MNARTRRARAVLRNRRRHAADARRLRYINGIYRDAYTGSLRLAAHAYALHTHQEPWGWLRDVRLIDDTEEEPFVKELTGYDLYLINRYT